MFLAAFGSLWTQDKEEFNNADNMTEFYYFRD